MFTRSIRIFNLFTKLSNKNKKHSTYRTANNHKSLRPYSAIYIVYLVQINILWQLFNKHFGSIFMAIQKYFRRCAEIYMCENVFLQRRRKRLEQIMSTIDNIVHIDGNIFAKYVELNGCIHYF